MLLIFLTFIFVNSFTPKYNYNQCNKNFNYNDLKENKFKSLLRSIWDDYN